MLEPFCDDARERISCLGEDALIDTADRFRQDGPVRLPIDRLKTGDQVGEQWLNLMRLARARRVPKNPEEERDDFVASSSSRCDCFEQVLDVQENCSVNRDTCDGTVSVATC